MLLRIQLLSTGQFFVMSNDGSLTIEVNSTIFNSGDDFLGSKSYPGSMPLEDNKALISNAHFITTPASLRTLDVLVWLGNLPWKQVKFNFKVTVKTIEYSLDIDAGIIANDISKLKLSQIQIGGNLASFDLAGFRQFMLDCAKAVPGTTPVVFFPVKNDTAYDDVPDADHSKYPDIKFPVQNYMNAWQNQAGVGSFLVDSFPTSTTELPFFYLVYVLKRVIGYFGFTPIGTWLNDPDANRICIYTQVPVDAFILADFWFFMPEMTVAEFFTACRNTFGLLIDPDHTRKVCVVESLKYLEDTPETIDLTGKQLTDFEEIDSQSDGFTITQKPDDKDDAFSDQDSSDIPTLVIGDGATGIELESVTTMMINEVSPATVSASQWRIAYMKQPVYGQAQLTEISKVSYKDRDNFKLRFLYYHGLVPDDAGFLYPYGSSDNVDQAGTQLTTFSLSLNASGSSYQALNHKYNFLKNCKPFTMTFELSKEEFLNLQVKKRILIRDFNQAPVSCILSSFSGDIDQGETIVTQLTLYPVVRPNNQAQIVVLPPDVPGGPIDNGTVYAKLQLRNPQSTQHPLPPPGYTAVQADLWVMFFSDAAGTTPKAVDQLPVRYNIRRVDTAGTVTTDSPVTTSCTGTEFELIPNAPTSSTSGGFTSWAYSLLASNYYHIIK